MDIVVLDGHTLNPGDLSWAPLEGLGRCKVHDRTPPEQTVARAAEAEIVLTNKTVLDRSVIEQLPEMRYIGVLATGYNVVDVAAARERDVVVTNVPAYAARSVAQMVFALLLELTQNVAHHAQTVRDGRWSACIDFCYWDQPLIELEGLTMGLVGFGRIGRAVAEIAQVFRMKVVAFDPEWSSSASLGVEFVSVDRLFEESDVVSLHCPLTPDTQGLVNAERLAQMKDTAFLINTSRGPVVDENALAEALAAGRLGGAGLDVLAVEPPGPERPILHAPNCFITPHIAWASQASRQRLMDTAVGNVKAFLAGQPENVVG